MSDEVMHKMLSMQMLLLSLVAELDAVSQGLMKSGALVQVPCSGRGCHLDGAICGSVVCSPWTSEF